MIYYESGYGSTKQMPWLDVVLLPNRTFVLMERYGQQRDFIDAGGRCDAQPQQRRRSMTDRLGDCAGSWLLMNRHGMT